MFGDYSRGYSQAGMELLEPLDGHILTFENLQPRYEWNPASYNYESDGVLPPERSLLFGGVFSPSSPAPTKTYNRPRIHGPLACPSGGAIIELPPLEEEFGLELGKGSISVQQSPVYDFYVEHKQGLRTSGGARVKPAPIYTGRTSSPTASLFDYRSPKSPHVINQRASLRSPCVMAH